MLISELGMRRQRRAQLGTQRPVIVVPGYLGTKLKSQASGEPVWGHFGFQGVLWTAGRHLRNIAIPMKPGVSVVDLKDDLVPSGLVGGVLITYLPFLPIQLQAYIGIIHQLERLGYCGSCEVIGQANGLPSKRQMYVFEYDWRRSNELSAAMLAQFIEEKQRKISRDHQIAEQDVEFDIICHSNGCLVARYFLRYGAQPLMPTGALPSLDWRGAKGIRNLVMLAPPNGGSLEAVLNTKEGLRYFGFGYSPVVIGSFPSVYQLFPRKRHHALMGQDSQMLDPLDADFWEASQWGPFDPREDPTLSLLLPGVSSRKDRLAIVKEHVQKCMSHARRFHTVLDQPASPPKSLKMWLFLGKDQPTASMYKQAEDGEWTVKKELLGDGQVVATSALMDESVGGLFADVSPRSPIAWSGVMMIFAKHLDLTRNDEFVTNLSFILDDQGILQGLR